MRLLALIALPAAAVVGLAAWNPAAVAPSPAPQPTAGGAYQVDAAHSSVVFRVKHAGASWFYGRFNEFSGSIEHDPENPEASSVEVTIQAGSVDSNSERRDTHIKSPDFLSAKEFPAITFKSTSVKAAGDDLEVTGDLSFRGVTKSVTAVVEHVGVGEFQGKRSGFEAVLDIKRTDFGSDYGVAQGALSDEVRLIIALEGVQQ
jgi:polyisoprenoid-binding protein YceI